MVLFTRNVKKIKGAAHNSDGDGTCKRSINSHKSICRQGKKQITRTKLNVTFIDGEYEYFVFGDPLPVQGVLQEDAASFRFYPEVHEGVRCLVVNSESVKIANQCLES